MYELSDMVQTLRTRYNNPNVLLYKPQPLLVHINILKTGYSYQALLRVMVEFYEPAINEYFTVEDAVNEFNELYIRPRCRKTRHGSVKRANRRYEKRCIQVSDAKKLMGEVIKNGGEQ